MADHKAQYDSEDAGSQDISRDRHFYLDSVIGFKST